MGLLYNVLIGKPRHTEWGTDQQAFDATKGAFASATTLLFPSLGAPLTFTTDASNVAVVVQSIKLQSPPTLLLQQKAPPG